MLHSNLTQQISGHDSLALPTCQVGQIQCNTINATTRTNPPPPKPLRGKTHQTIGINYVARHNFGLSCLITHSNQSTNQTESSFYKCTFTKGSHYSYRPAAPPAQSCPSRRRPTAASTSCLHTSCMRRYSSGSLADVCVHTHGCDANCRVVAGESKRNGLGNGLDMALLNLRLEVIHGPMLAITCTPPLFGHRAQ